jgi:class 3 adenylate cyclase/HAMP domain-containing protein
MATTFVLHRLGVGGRLLIAFFGISGFAVLGAAAGIFSFLEIGKSLEWITERKVPAALASQELSRQAERIVAAAPTLLAVTTQAQYSERSKIIAAEMGHLESQLSELKKQDVPSDTIDAMEAGVAHLQRNLSLLDELVSRRLTIDSRKKEILDALVKSAADAQLLLEPWLLVMDAKVTKWRKSVTDASLGDEDRKLANADLEASLAWFRALQRVRLSISSLTAMLQQAATADSANTLKVSSFRLKRFLAEARKLVPSLDPKLRPLISESLDEFDGYVGGANSIPDLRSTELEVTARAEQTLRENAELSLQLTAAVDFLVDNANRDITAANQDVLQIREISTWVLTAAVALSLLCSLLIVWLYVGRNIVARLETLSNSMLAIASGDLRATLPAPGDSDEIDRMAKALTVFRDTAVEVEEKNLREIEETRRRLVDAIENTSEGFAFYDKDDQLELCNSRYKELLFEGIDIDISPGTSFEEIIRLATDQGLIANAVGHEEEWVAQRLMRHRNPGEPQVEQLGDGRWILISERKTDDGGTVAVYADISELKQREEELSEKSSTLEQLSNQLAKYLSPQVYDSIFSGKQEVKVASSRKKLTVFFSDIVGFTETADRLESEELTQIFNHYLSEMSDIALAYGATIDKYIGDAILIFFGDPESKGVKADALACVKMAIAMRERMYALADEWRASGVEKPLRIRMGIHTGFCTVGNFGSEDRMDYTIIGGAVNAASRLETAAEPGEILISYETFAHVHDQIMCEEHGELEVKGIAYPIATYRVVDLFENLSDSDGVIRTERPNLKLEVDIGVMSSDERKEAVNLLQDALDRLADTGLKPQTATSSETHGTSK